MSMTQIHSSYNNRHA